MTIGGLYNLQALAKLSYAMTDLSNLAKKYDIELDLYHITSLNLVFDLIGDFRKRKFITETVEESLSKREKWAKLIEFLDKEIRILEETYLSEENKIYNLRRDSKDIDMKKSSSVDNNKHFVVNSQNTRVLMSNLWER